MDAALSTAGYQIVEGVLSASATAELIGFVETALKGREGRGGLRNLLDDSSMLALAGSPEMRGLVEPVLGPDHFAVRGLLFDKTADANWKVPWHQDVTIAVRERVDVPGYGPWSVKQGVLHVQPPASVLERMLTVRLHLDSCPEENGALRILPGSHVYGKLGEANISQLAQQAESTVCEVKAGGALLMRPLLVHASSAAAVAGHRRVLHFDFAACELSDELEWNVRG